MEQFGKYILLERLAAGGMAEVYLSKSTGAEGVNKFLAIKRILPQYSDQKEFIEMFKEEAKIAINLNHSNVVSLYDFGVERSQFFIVMEYVEGKNLRQILSDLKKNNTQLTLEQIIFIVKEVATGLDHAHRCLESSTGKPLNIVHRDMSPQNIMISFEGEVKIIDFGIAKAETQLEATKAGTLKGKYGYMSPEQADGQIVDHRTDIFSLGIIMWELLANDRLFTSNNEAAILRKIRDCQVPSIRKINPSVPPELERILSKALAKDRSLRYQNASALHRDLNRFLNTHYPEFSSQDFSVFMKNAFSETFLEQRKKIVEFAKVQATVVEDGTVILGGSFAPPPMPPPPSQLNKNSNDIKDSDDLLDINTDINTEHSVKLEGLKPISRQTIITKANTNPVSSTYTNSGGQSKTQASRPPLRAPSGGALEGILKIALLLVVVAGGWWLYSEKMSSHTKDEAIPKIAHAPAYPVVPKPQDNEVQQTDMAANQPDYAISIYSVPDRARIVIDGVDTGEFTPARKTVKANTPFNLRLVKEGFTDLVTTVTPTYEPFNFTGTLQKLAKVGSLVINVVNGGANPELSIGGVPVSIKPLGSAYIVQAEVGVLIQAKNKTTGLSAEETIVVPADQKKIIDLYLK
jgi:serine/threonine-protein kinase